MIVITNDNTGKFKLKNALHIWKYELKNKRAHFYFLNMENKSLTKF